MASVPPTDSTSSSSAFRPSPQPPSPAILQFEPGDAVLVPSPAVTVAATPVGTPVSPTASVPVSPTANLVAGQLTAGWRAVLTFGWLATVVGLFAVHDTASFIGKPTWWQLHSVGFVPFIVPILAGTVSYINHRWAVWASFVGVLAVGISAAVSRPAAPGASLVEAAIGAAMLLLTIASFAGRMRPRR